MLFIYSVNMVSRTEKNILMEKNVHSLDTWKINSHENLRRKKFLGKFEKKYEKKCRKDLRKNLRKKNHVNLRTTFLRKMKKIWKQN